MSLAYMCIIFIGQALWEVKMFDTVNRRKSDGRTPEHGYIISYSAQANLKGSCIHVYSSLSRCVLMLNVSDVADVPP